MFNAKTGYWITLFFSNCSQISVSNIQNVHLQHIKDLILDQPAEYSTLHIEMFLCATCSKHLLACDKCSTLWSLLWYAQWAVHWFLLWSNMSAEAVIFTSARHSVLQITAQSDGFTFVSDDLNTFSKAQLGNQNRLLFWVALIVQLNHEIRKSSAHLRQYYWIKLFDLEMS